MKEHKYITAGGSTEFVHPKSTIQKFCAKLVRSCFISLLYWEVRCGLDWGPFLRLSFAPLWKKEKDKHNDAVPVSNFVSRSICSPQFDAASIKTEQQSLQTEWKVVYGTLRNHHLVALRVELKRSKLCFIFRGYAISKKKKRKRKKFGFASLCCKYFFFFCFGIR